MTHNCHNWHGSTSIRRSPSCCCETIVIQSVLLCLARKETKENKNLTSLYDKLQMFFFGKFAKRVGNNAIFLVCFLTYIYFNYRQSPCKSIVLDDSAKSASIDVSQPHHAKTTDHAKPTDRLANDEVVMIIRSTYKKHGMYMRDRIIPSSRTWMRGLINVFVVLEDTFEVRSYLRSVPLTIYTRFFPTLSY